MKLLFAIVQDEDEKPLVRALIEHEFSVTRISSSGGFLRSGNATLMIGVETAKLQQALDIIKTESHRRKSFVSSPLTPSHAADSMPLPMQVNVGGATVFLIDVEQFYKY